MRLKIINEVNTYIIKQISALYEEQQEFRYSKSRMLAYGKSCKKSVQYNKPAYLCFVDLQKTIERISLKDFKTFTTQ